MQRSCGVCERVYAKGEDGASYESLISSTIFKRINFSHHFFVVRVFALIGWRDIVKIILCCNIALHYLCVRPRFAREVVRLRKSNYIPSRLKIFHLNRLEAGIAQKNIKTSVFTVFNLSSSLRKVILEAKNLIFTLMIMRLYLIQHLILCYNVCVINIKYIQLYIIAMSIHSYGLR